MPLHGDPERILLVRLSAIGDAILTLPMLCALRRRFPKAYIAWVAEPGPAKIIGGHEALDELIVVRKGWMRHPSQVWQLRRQLRRLCFDLALDSQGLTKSSVVAWLSGAPRRIGFTKPWGRELSPWLNNDLQTPRVAHVVDRLLGMLEPLGIVNPKAEFNIPGNSQAEESIADMLVQQQVGSPLVVINVGAGWFSRVWPPERFGAVAKHLAARHQISSLVVWAGEQELEWAREIERSSEGAARLAPPTSLGELTALLRRANLYLGSDTGPMHLAAAVGTRCVGLFGSTRPEDSGPYGEGHICLQAWYQSGTCRKRRKASNDAMRAITVEETCRACERILLRNTSSAA